MTGDMCRKGYQERETLSNIILDCPHFDKNRLKLTQECARSQHAFNVKNSMCHPCLHPVTEGFFCCPKWKKCLILVTIFTLPYESSWVMFIKKLKKEKVKFLVFQFICETDRSATKSEKSSRKEAQTLWWFLWQILDFDDFVDGLEDNFENMMRFLGILMMKF